MIMLCDKKTNEVVATYYLLNSIEQVSTVEREHNHAYKVDYEYPTVDIPHNKSIRWFYDGTVLSHKFIDIPPAPQTEQDIKLDKLQAKLDYLAVMTGNEEVL